MDDQKKSTLEYQIYLFHQGTAHKAYEFMGAHPGERDGVWGCTFRTWAPNAKNVYVAGNFNWWAAYHPMERVTDKGLWETFIPGISIYEVYKFIIEDKAGVMRYKADPYAYHCELRPSTGSKIISLQHYEWRDEKWREEQKTKSPHHEPMNIYEVHFGAWRKYGDGNFFNYSKMAEELIPYVKEMGYTHVELMPMSEYPYDGSWGYQCTGYYAATARYGKPADFMAFVDECHVNGIGVILDWVPGHYPKDEAGLYKFDGDYCYEYQDFLKNEHKDWGTMIFDWGRNEVRSFLISNAVFWMDQYHVDGLRVDAVASMLYLDYGKNHGEWRPNVHGGHENLEAIAFLRDLNTAVFAHFPNALMMAEESTSWPLVTKPADVGGLGFNFKWNMGWMNDSLFYIKQDPYFRSGCHNNLTFVMTYFTSENYILPLSHDEVVHMKGSLLNKMPGTYDEKFANLRAYFVYMMTHPGKKLLFMGGEFAHFAEWNFEKELDWNLLEYPAHREFHAFVKDLNFFYKEHSELWELDDSWDGFEWIDPDDCNNNVLTYKRKNRAGDELIIISNFAAVPHYGYQLKLNPSEKFERLFSSDDEKYGGEGDTQFMIENGVVAIPQLSTSIWRKIREV